LPAPQPFWGPRQTSAEFVATAFAGDVGFQGAQFEHGAAFDSARVTGRVFFRPVTAYGPYQLDQQQPTLSVRFGGEARFTNFDVAGLAFYQAALFLCGAMFSLAHFRASANFAGTTLLGTTDFNNCRIDGNAIFSESASVRAAFHGTSNFTRAQFAGLARFRFVEFDVVPPCALPRDRANFNACTFGGDADFQSARFAQGASFDSARIEGRAFFRPVTTTPPGRLVEFGAGTSFVSIQIKNQAQFQRATFHSRADFGFATFSSSALFTRATFNETSFGGAHFEQYAGFRGVTFSGPLDFSNSHFRPNLDFRTATFKSRAQFTEADARTVFFRDSLVAKRPTKEGRQFLGTVDLRGFAYTRIYVAWHDLLDAFRDWDDAQTRPGVPSLHERQPYAQLESSLRAMGRDRHADDVYYHMRRHEWKQRWRLRPLKTLVPRWVFNWPGVWDTFEWLITLYGVRPWPLAIGALLLILIGANVFIYPNAVIPKQPATSTTQASLITTASPPQQRDTWDAIGISLSQFLPVDAAWASDMKPARTIVPVFHDVPVLSAWDLRVDAQMYGAVHRAVGWLVIPVAIATVAGWLRRQVRR
jgi:uncharacterized protein YjbI with pentapeptide repeats